MNFQELAEKRFSCRKFSDKKVEKELVEQIIKAGLTAPTAVNKQPFEIFWLESEQVKEDLKKVCRYTFGAQTFLLVASKSEEGWIRPFDQRNFADIDATIAATHMMMEIEDLGLSTTWVGYFDAPSLKSMYPQLQPYELLALFPIGYAAPDAEPSPLHFQRKRQEEMVQIL